MFASIFSIQKFISLMLKTIIKLYVIRLQNEIKTKTVTPKKFMIL